MGKNKNKNQQALLQPQLVYNPAFNRRYFQKTNHSLNTESDIDVF